jgi:hypothetical protein
MRNYNLVHYGELCQMVRNSGKHVKGVPVHRFGSDSAVVIGDTIVIDGSDNLREWASNLLFLRFGRKGTHAGFAIAANRIFDEVKSIAEPDKIITIVGHSRGGAIAQLLAMLLSELGCFCRVVSFGSPKVGGRKFRERMAELNVIHIRVEMEGDPVCRLPMWWKHYATDSVYIANEEKGTDCHLKYWEYL